MRSHNIQRCVKIRKMNYWVLSLTVIQYFIAQVSPMVAFRMQGGNQNSFVKAYDGVPWMHASGTESLHNRNGIALTNATGYALVNLNVLVKGYNPCDSSTFDATRDHNLLFHPNTSSNSSGWVGIVDYAALLGPCGRSPLHFFYSSYTAWSAQKLGASGVIIISSSAQADQLVIPPQVDSKRGEVWGEIISIPVVSVLDSSNIALVSRTASEWLVTSIVTDDTGNDAILKIFGVTHCISLAISAYYIGLACFIVRHLCQLRLQRVQAELASSSSGKGSNGNLVSEGKSNRSRVSTLRFVILYSELVHAIARSISFVDYLGFFHFFGNYFSQIIIGQFSTQISIFNNIVTILYCYDVYRLINRGRKMQKTQSLFTRYKWFIPVILLLSSFIAIVYLVNAYAVIVGIGVNGGNTIDQLYIICVEIIVIVATINLNFRAKKELADILMQTSRKKHQLTITGPIASPTTTATTSRVATAIRTPSVASEAVRIKLMHFDRTRRYMMKSLIGISLDAASFILLVAILVTKIQALALLLIPLQGFGPMISSSYEVLAAIDYATIPSVTTSVPVLSLKEVRKVAIEVQVTSGVVVTASVHCTATMPSDNSTRIVK